MEANAEEVEDLSADSGDNNNEDDEDVVSMFNPQEIDYDEVSRLRQKVTDLEGMLASAAKGGDSMQVVLKSYMDTQEASRREQAEANVKLMTIISELHEECRDLKDKNFEMKVQLEMSKNEGPKEF